MPSESPRVVVYSTRFCGFCSLARSLLRERGIPFEDVDVSSDPEKRAWLVQVTGRRTVPQIFIDGQPIGGFTDLRKLDQSGELELRLQARPRET